MQVPVIHVLEGLRGQPYAWGFSHELVFFFTLNLISEALEEVA